MRACNILPVRLQRLSADMVADGSRRIVAIASACILLIAALSAGVVRAEVLPANTVWEGEVVISETVTVPAQATLAVRPGTVVRFRGEGRIFSQGRFEARGARFEADGPIEGRARLHFDSHAAVTRLEDCSFINLTVVNDRTYFNSFLVNTVGAIAIEGCRMERTTSVEIARTNSASFIRNQMIQPARFGLILFKCGRATVSGNHFESQHALGVMISALVVDNARITGNRLFGMNPRCVGISIAQGSVSNTVAGNSIFHAGVGIRIMGKDCVDNQLLSNLVFAPRHVGIAAAGAGTGNGMHNGVIWEAGEAALRINGPNPLLVRNTVFAKSRTGIELEDGAALPQVAHCCFWNNGTDASASLREAIMQAKGHVFADPLFVDAPAGNFRLQSVRFGHPADSPLRATGSPSGTSIGLYPDAAFPVTDNVAH